jgi:hypothetical protein
MGFHGYYFNKFKQKYLTYKYPHCYVGIIQKLEDGQNPFWGNYEHGFKKSVWIGDYSGGAIVTHIIGKSDCTRSVHGNDWDVYVENAWHGIIPTSVNNNVKRMCDANFNELLPDGVAITMFYKAVVPTYSWDLALKDSLMFGTSYSEKISTLFHGSVIGIPGARGVSGNNYRYSLLKVDPTLVESDSAYDLPSNSVLNQTSTPMSDFPAGNDILDFNLNIYHQFPDANNVMRNYNVREVDKNVSFNSPFEFLGVNWSGGSGAKMVSFAYDVAPTDRAKATQLTYDVNHNLALFNIPNNDGDVDGHTMYMIPELFQPFMMVLPNTGNAGSSDLGNMALYCVFGVKAV